MATAQVLHVGGDDSHRAQVLRSAGYAVDECATLGEMVTWFRGGKSLDVVCISEDPHCPTEGAVAAAHAFSQAPVVLFRAKNRHYTQRGWELDVQPLTPPEVWLGELATLIGKTRATVEASRELRLQSAQLREASVKERMRSRVLREAIEKQLERTGSDT